MRLNGVRTISGIDKQLQGCVCRHRVRLQGLMNNHVISAICKPPASAITGGGAELVLKSVRPASSQVSSVPSARLGAAFAGSNVVNRANRAPVVGTVACR